ncbi:MAG TPA: hypothetical protein VMR62_17920 [Bryobacteraceae bacterium]|jgi:hypothetical protein|nr:hypothetical protein [Bryobacteraceae bacterium]
MRIATWNINSVRRRLPLVLDWLTANKPDVLGEDSPELLSGRLRGSLQKKKKLAQESLKGYFNDFHRQMLEMHYRHYEFINLLERS